MTLTVVFTPEAQIDLLDIYDSIASQGTAEVALADVERIQAVCEGLSESPKRGPSRSDIRPGLRVIGFERRVAIAFHILDQVVTIDRVLYGGRDLGLIDPA